MTHRIKPYRLDDICKYIEDGCKIAGCNREHREGAYTKKTGKKKCANNKSAFGCANWANAHLDQFYCQTCWNAKCAKEEYDNSLKGADDSPLSPRVELDAAQPLPDSNKKSEDVVPHKKLLPSSPVKMAEASKIYSVFQPGPIRLLGLPPPSPQKTEEPVSRPPPTLTPALENDGEVKVSPSFADKLRDAKNWYDSVAPIQPDHLIRWVTKLIIHSGIIIPNTTLTVENIKRQIRGIDCYGDIAIESAQKALIKIGLIRDAALQSKSESLQDAIKVVLDLLKSPRVMIEGCITLGILREDADDHLNGYSDEIIAEALSELCNRGFLKKIGTSVYTQNMDE